MGTDNHPSVDRANNPHRMKTKRMDVKLYREKLNRDSTSGPMWLGRGNRGQRKRPYGDYLYAQDRAKFECELGEWIAAGRPA